jgi:hypothetical protein
MCGRSLVITPRAIPLVTIECASRRVERCGRPRASVVERRRPRNENGRPSRGAIRQSRQTATSVRILVVNPRELVVLGRRSGVSVLEIPECFIVLQDVLDLFR